MRPDIRPARDDTSSLEVLGTIGPAGIGTFLVVVVAMHVFRPDLDPIDSTSASTTVVRSADR